MITEELRVELRQMWEEEQRLSPLPLLSAGWRTIQLTKGLNTLVDLEDFIRFGHLKWYSLPGTDTVYAARQSPVDYAGKQPHIRLHRLVNNTPEDFDTHHKNTDGRDNRRDNLETRTRIEHSQGRQKYKKSSSRFKGVSYHKQTNKWQASICVDRNVLYLGCYLTEIEAAQAYDWGSREYHGEFGKTNEQLLGRYWEDP